MSWDGLSLCFELLSPLFVGYLPNRSGTVVAPTRYYVPSKTIWGAVTASLTPRLYDNPQAKNYKTVGCEIKENVCFSYFYLTDGKQIYTPEYTGEGLKWGGKPDAEFRNKFIDSFVSTAKNRASGTAKDQTLHEIEFIRHQIKLNAHKTGKVYLAGKVWFKNGFAINGQKIEKKNNSLVAVPKDINLFKDLVIGGDRSYGFGRVKYVELTTKIDDIFKINNSEDLKIKYTKGEPLIAHLKYDESLHFKGDIEIIAEREYPDSKSDNEQNFKPKPKLKNYGYYFAPGTLIMSYITAQMDCFGRLTKE